MAKRRGPKPKLIPMKVGNDPTLWRYASMREAIETNTDLLAQLIRASKEQEQANTDVCETGDSEPNMIAEGA